MNNLNFTWDMTPSLHDFITTRDESFGGYVYNPYFYYTLQLDNVEKKVVDLFDGRHKLKEIYEAVSSSLPYGPEANMNHFINLIQRLQNIYAIDWRKRDNDKQDKTRSSAITNQKKTRIAPQSDFLSAPLSILWDITYACNLRCDHCLSSSGTPKTDELKLDEIKRIIDQLAAMKVLTITFCGGEPLARKDFYDVLKYASKYNMGLKLTTNGGLITKKVLKEIDDFNIFGVKVSLDGTEKTHDKFRKKKGSYKKAVNAIKLLSEAGYYTIVSPVINKLNVDEIDYVLEMAVILKASSFSPSMFMPSGRGKTNKQSLLLSSKELKRSMQKLLKKKKELEGIISIEFEGTYPGLNDDDKVLSKCTYSDNIRIGCAAKVQLVITGSGKVVPCPFLYDFVAGDLRKDSLEDIWYNSKLLHEFRNMRKSDLKGKCKSCEHIPEECQGGCRAAAHLYYGDLYAEDPICWK